VGWCFSSSIYFSFECARQPNTGSRRVLGKSKQESEKQARFYLDKVGLAEKQGLIRPTLWWTKATGSERSLCEPQVMLFDEPTSALDPELVGKCYT